MMTDYLKQLTAGKDLSFEESMEIASQLMDATVDEIKVASLLTALKTKGETYEEISGFAMGLKKHALPIISDRKILYDIVGTGGDGADTFNISTTTAIVLAGAGLNMAKHGNRSVSSRCGSGDVLEALGINIQTSKEQMENQLNQVGISFLYAPLVHPSMKNVMGIRRKLGIPTIFNIIGPLANPMSLDGQYIGVFRRDLVEVMAKSLVKMGIEKGAVVYGAGGLDEASLEGANEVAFIKKGLVYLEKVDGVDFGLDRYPNSVLKGGSAEENACITQEILMGQKGPKRSVILLNAAIALYAFEKVSSIAKGIDMAAESIDSGAAKDKLDQLVAVSKEGEENGQHSEQNR